MKLDRLHYTLGAAAAAFALSCIYLAAALSSSRDEAHEYMKVGAFALINGQNQVVKAVHDAHDARASDDLLERYMTPEGARSYRASLAPQIRGAKLQAIELPAVDRAALDRVIALASQQPPAAK